MARTKIDDYGIGHCWLSERQQCRYKHYSYGGRGRRMILLLLLCAHAFRHTLESTTINRRFLVAIIVVDINSLL